jgi:hypothetical protein
MAVAIAIVTGLFGAILLLSNALAGYSLWQLWLIVISMHAVPAIAVGVLIPKRWYVAIVAAWGGCAIDGVLLVAYLRVRGNTYPAGFYAGSPLLGFVFIPIALLVGGYLGRRIAGIKA